MNVLITGGAGFIGSHLAEALLSAGSSVTVVDDLSTGALHNIRHLLGREGFQFVRESVRNPATMAVVVGKCDAIFHLAAAVGVQLIADRPVHTIETNIHGSEVVLNLANKFGRKTFLASSSEVYGKSTKLPFSEDDDSLLGSTRFTRWCYGCSKMVDEFLALAYQEQYGLEPIIGRLFNTIGPRQTGAYGMVVPRFVRAALRNEPLTVHGTGEQIRCFCNVADVVETLDRLMDCDAAVGEVVNIGSDQPISINQLAGKIIEMAGSSSQIRHLTYEEAYGRPFDDTLARVPDLTKIRRLIGYEPRYSLDETLGQIIEHERAELKSEPGS